MCRNMTSFGSCVSSGLLVRFALLVFCTFESFGGVARAAELTQLACVVAETADVGRVTGSVDFPDDTVLLRSGKGLFLGVEDNQEVKVEQVGETGTVYGFYDFPSVGLVVSTEKGLFLGRKSNGKFGLVAVEGASLGGPITVFHPFNDGVALIGAVKGLFQVRYEGGTLRATALDDVDTQGVFAMHEFPDGQIAVGARKGLFLLRKGGDFGVTQSVEIGLTLKFHERLDGDLLIQGSKTLLLAHYSAGKLNLVEPTEPADLGSISSFHNLPNGEVLASAENGLFVARKMSGEFVVSKVDGSRAALGYYELPDSSTLLRTERGLLVGSWIGDNFNVGRVNNAELSPIGAADELPGLGVVVGGNDHLFLAQGRVGDSLRLMEIASDPLGRVFNLLRFPNGLIVGSEKGTSLARVISGRPASLSSTGLLL
jgi:hypothetical protein